MILILPWLIHWLWDLVGANNRLLIVNSPFFDDWIDDDVTIEDVSNDEVSNNGEK